jgi:hypothetical protein
MSALDNSRRDFLKAASLLTAGAVTVGAAAGCQVQDPKAANAEDTNVRVQGFDRALLDAVAVAVLPESLGPDGVRAATDQFVAWSDGYDPVAEEMHGYGYSDVRYLPADPAPAWRAQLTALELLSRRTHHTRFVQLSVAQRRALISATLRAEPGDRLPAPLGARHVVLALLGHWASTPDAWNRAFGVQLSPATCRSLDDAVTKPIALSKRVGA